MVIVCDVTGIGHQISFKNKVMKPKNVIPYPAFSSSNSWIIVGKHRDSISSKKTDAFYKKKFPFSLCRKVPDDAR